MPTYDVVIVGGGLVGAACADAAAGEGLSVCLLEAGALAREASWAGAGILNPIHPWDYPAPLLELVGPAIAEHLRCAEDLRERTGIDVELIQSGLILMGEAGERAAAWYRGEPQRWVEAAAEEPALQEGGSGLLLPHVYQIRNHRLARALLEGARRRGATIQAHMPVLALRPDGVATAQGPVRAGSVVVCAGAWTARLCPGVPVEPVRGQILLYQGHARRMVVFPDGSYVVPRRDGRLLFGSTLEQAGFDNRPTEEAYRRLEGLAGRYLGLGPEALQAAWAGLRPGTPGRMPFIGRLPGRETVLVAAGHYRNGILLAPLTGRLLADLLCGRDPGIDLAPFQPGATA